MTTIDRREALADLGIIALLTTKDGNAVTRSQQTWMERYLYWLHERYAANVEVELSILDDATYVVSADGEAGTRYVLHVPRHGSPFVWKRRGGGWAKQTVRSFSFHLSIIERD